MIRGRPGGLFQSKAKLETCRCNIHLVSDELIELMCRIDNDDDDDDDDDNDE